jgi:hypothetical protein
VPFERVACDSPDGVVQRVTCTSTFLVLRAWMRNAAKSSSKR